MTRAVTTTTSEAEAIDELLSKVSMSPANGSTKQPLARWLPFAQGCSSGEVRVSRPREADAQGRSGRGRHEPGTRRASFSRGPPTRSAYIVVGSSPGAATTGVSARRSGPLQRSRAGYFHNSAARQHRDSERLPVSGDSRRRWPADRVHVLPAGRYPGRSDGRRVPLLDRDEQACAGRVALVQFCRASFPSDLVLARGRPGGGQRQPNGWDAGGGAWGGGTLSTAFVIGNSHISVVNLATHEMTVTDNGQLLYTWPISAGQPRWPTQDGTHIVLDRESVVHMISSTVGIPVKSPAGYNEFVYWDVHISDSGEYVHAAPWSVAEQGFENVSHGCVNLSPARAEAFFHFSRVGDIIDVIDGVRPPLQGDHGVMDWSFGGRRDLDAGQGDSADDVGHHDPGHDPAAPARGSHRRPGPDLAAAQHDHNGHAHHHDHRPDHNDYRGHGARPEHRRPRRARPRSLLPTTPASAHDGQVGPRPPGQTGARYNEASYHDDQGRPDDRTAWSHHDQTSAHQPRPGRAPTTTTKPVRPRLSQRRPPQRQRRQRHGLPRRPRPACADHYATRPHTRRPRPDTRRPRRPAPTTTRPAPTTTQPPTTTTSTVPHDDLDGPAHDHEHLKHDLDYCGRRDHDDRLRVRAASG